MKPTVINPEILAQRLEHAADVYDKDAILAREVGDVRLRQVFERQAHETREWADAFRNVGKLGFEGDDIEVWS